MKSQISSWRLREKIIAGSILLLFLIIGVFFSIKPKQCPWVEQTPSSKNAPTSAPAVTQSVPPVDQGSAQFIVLPDGTKISMGGGGGGASPIGQDGRVLLAWKPLPGLKCKSIHSGYLKLDVINSYRAYQQPETKSPGTFEVSWKRKYSDQYAQVGPKGPSEIVRTTEEDSLTTQNAQTNKLEATDQAMKGSTVRLRLLGNGGVEVLNDDAEARVIDACKSLRVTTFLPNAAVAEGGEWILIDSTIKAYSPFAIRGDGKLKLVKTALDPQLNQYVSYMSGPVRIDYEIPRSGEIPFPMHFEGTLTVKYLPAFGIEILRKLEGRMTADFPYSSGAISGRLVGSGDYREVVSTEAIS